MGTRLVVHKGGIEEPKCKQACPLGVEVPLYIRLIREGNYREAAEVIRRNAPLAGVLAYVCPRYCEGECRRAEIDEAIAINALKRFVLDRWVERPESMNKKVSNKKVAIIGSGPSGLSAAYYLRNSYGIDTTVFDKLPDAGGMMRFGIPKYRLPRKVLDREIEMIKECGVKFEQNVSIKSTEDLFATGFNAIFISVGAWKTKRLMIDGEKSDGTIDGLSFLKDVNSEKFIEVKKNVAIIGGGNVAIDAARVARRLGAENVCIFYRRSREEMPSRSEEIEQALEEDIKIYYLVAPLKIEQKEKGLSLTFINIKLAGLDETGRREPIQIAGSEFDMYFDTVITAIGENPEIPEDFKIDITSDCKIKIDKETLLTNRDGIFAGGDCVTGPATVVKAIAAGKKAAINIVKYLGTKRHDIFDKNEEASQDTAPWDESILDIPRQRMRLSPKLNRVRNFEVVELGFTEGTAKNEAKRCLLCDLALAINIDTTKCVECYSCQMTCSFAYTQKCNPERSRIVFDNENNIHFNSECVGGCLLCVNNCLSDALSYENVKIMG